MKRKLLAMAVVFTMILSQFTMLPLAADGDGTSPEVYFKSEGLVDTVTLGDELSIYPDEYAYTEDEDGDEEFLNITGINITEGDATVSMEKDEDDYDYYSIKPSKSGQIKEDIVQHGDTKSAVTHYQVEKEWTVPYENESGAGEIPLSLIRLQLETGRMHQIRIHLAKQGCPIAGDDQHGNFKMNKLLKKVCKIKRLQLASVRLTIPLEGKERIFEVSHNFEIS